MSKLFSSLILTVATFFTVQSFANTQEQPDPKNIYDVLNVSEIKKGKTAKKEVGGLSCLKSWKICSQCFPYSNVEYNFSCEIQPNYDAKEIFEHLSVNAYLIDSTPTTKVWQKVIDGILCQKSQNLDDSNVQFFCQFPGFK